MKSIKNKKGKTDVLTIIIIIIIIVFILIWLRQKGLI